MFKWAIYVANFIEQKWLERFRCVDSIEYHLASLQHSSNLWHFFSLPFSFFFSSCAVCTVLFFFLNQWSLLLFCINTCRCRFSRSELCVRAQMCVKPIVKLNDEDGERMGEFCVISIKVYGLLNKWNYACAVIVLHFDYALSVIISRTRTYSFSFAFLHAATNQLIFFFLSCRSLSLASLSLLVALRLFPFLRCFAVFFLVRLRLFFNCWWIKLYVYSCSCCFGCVTEPLLFCGFCVLLYYHYYCCCCCYGCCYYY